MARSRPIRGLWARARRLARYQFLRLLRLQASPHNIALGLALGIFVGFLPIVPFQSVLVITLAFVFRGSKVAGFLGTWISNPIDLPLFYYGLFLVGRLALPVEGVVFNPHHLAMADMIKAGWDVFAVMCVGGVILGLPSAMATYMVTLRTVKAYRGRKAKRLLARRAGVAAATGPRPWAEVRQDAALWKTVRLSPLRVLILDYDGTLAPFVEDRTKARLYEGVREVLAAIMERPDSRVIFVTGREARELLGLLDLPSQPEVWGSHGGERLLPSGEIEPMEVGFLDGEALARAEAWALGQGLGDRLERKPGCLALHVRGLPPARAGDLLRDVSVAWGETAIRSGLGLHDFDGGLELRAMGCDKGRAVACLLQQARAEAGAGAMVFYLGDDTTDEDAFAILEGLGVGILVRPEARPTKASAWLRPPGELLEFLLAWLDAC